MKKTFSSALFWQAASIILLAFFVFNQAGGEIFRQNKHSQKMNLVGQVFADDIYPMFTCPCCGQPLNKQEPCCGSMTDMISYIDKEIATGKAKDEVVLSTVRQFGINRLTSQNDQETMKKKLADMAPSDSPKIEMAITEKDLGDISLNQGIVTVDFELINSGKSDLVINKLNSSCGCTSAAIIYNLETGPKFTMEGHGQANPTDWQVSIKPEDTAILRIFYDPSVHPDLEGAVTRTVSVFSNDPVEFEKTITIILTQTK